MNEAVTPSERSRLVARDWGPWLDAAARRQPVDAWLLVALVVLVGVLVGASVVVGGLRSFASVWAWAFFLPIFGAGALIADRGSRWLASRRAIETVPRTDGAACPTCARALVDPAQRPDQADGAVTMRCDRCERRWPLEHLRAAWAESATNPRTLARFAAACATSPNLAAPSAHPSVLVAIRRQLVYWGLFVVTLLLFSWTTGFNGVLSNLFLPALMIGITMIALALRGRAGEAPHCAKCGHAVPPGDDAASRCTECGAALRARGAVERGERVRRPGVAVAGVAVIAVAGLLAMGRTTMFMRGGAVGAWMPTPVLIRSAARGGLIDHNVAQRELATRSLAPAEEIALATAHIDGLRIPFNEHRVDTAFLETLRLGNRLPNDLLVRWYRESVEVLLTAPRRAAAGEDIPISIEAEVFTGGNLVWRPNLVIGEVAIDGVVVQGLRSQECATADVFMAKARPSPHAGGVDKPLLAPSPGPGTHTIRVRVWTIIRPVGAHPAPIEWFADGSPVAPADAFFADSVDLEARVRVSGR